MPSILQVGRYGCRSDTENMFDFSSDTVLENFEKSLDRLQMKYVDLLQVYF